MGWARASTETVDNDVDKLSENYTKVLSRQDFGWVARKTGNQKNFLKQIFVCLLQVCA